MSLSFLQETPLSRLLHFQPSNLHREILHITSWNQTTPLRPVCHILSHPDEVCIYWDSKHNKILFQITNGIQKINSSGIKKNQNSNHFKQTQILLSRKYNLSKTLMKWRSSRINMLGNLFFHNYNSLQSNHRMLNTIAKMRNEEYAKTLKRAFA